MGESQNQPFQLSFNRLLRVDFQGSRVTSDGGLLLVRELDERLGLTGLIQNHLVDSRSGRIERQRFGRSEAIQWGEVLAGRLVGGENQTKPVSGTAKRAGRRGDPPNRSQGDLGLTRKGRPVYVFARK